MVNLRGCGGGERIESSPLSGALIKLAEQCALHLQAMRVVEATIDTARPFIVSGTSGIQHLGSFLLIVHLREGAATVLISGTNISKIERSTEEMVAPVREVETSAIGIRAAISVGRVIIKVRLQLLGGHIDATRERVVACLVATNEAAGTQVGTDFRMTEATEQHQVDGTLPIVRSIVVRRDTLIIQRRTLVVQRSLSHHTQLFGERACRAGEQIAGAVALEILSCPHRSFHALHLGEFMFRLNIEDPLLSGRHIARQAVDSGELVVATDGDDLLRSEVVQRRGSIISEEQFTIDIGLRNRLSGDRHRTVITHLHAGQLLHQFDGIIAQQRLEGSCMEDDGIAVHGEGRGLGGHLHLLQGDRARAQGVEVEHEL